MTASYNQPWQGQQWSRPGGSESSADRPGAAEETGAQPWPEWAQRTGGQPSQQEQQSPLPPRGASVPGASSAVAGQYPPAQQQYPQLQQQLPGRAGGAVHHTGTVLPAGRSVAPADAATPSMMAPTRAESLAREQLSREQRALQAAIQATQEVPRLPGYAPQPPSQSQSAQQPQQPQQQRPAAPQSQGAFPPAVGAPLGSPQPAQSLPPAQQFPSAQPQLSQTQPSQPPQSAAQYPAPQRQSAPQQPLVDHSMPSGSGSATAAYREPAVSTSYAAPARAVSYSAPASGVSYAAPAATVSYAPPASAVSYAAPAPPAERFGASAPVAPSGYAPGAAQSGYPSLGHHSAASATTTSHSAQTAPALRPAEQGSASWTEAPRQLRPQTGYEQPIAEYRLAEPEAARRAVQTGYGSPTGQVLPPAPRPVPQQVSPEAQTQVWTAAPVMPNIDGSTAEPEPLIPPPPLETVSGSGGSPAADYRSGEVPAVRGHWSAESDHLTREASPVSPSTGYSTSTPAPGHTLIVSESEDVLTGPLTSTGEIVLTGSLSLPRNFASTGAVGNIDGLDADQHEHHDDDLQDTSPVRAMRAVGSQHHVHRGGELMSPSKVTTALPTVLAVGGTILAVLTVGMVIGVFWLGLF